MTLSLIMQYIDKARDQHTYALLMGPGEHVDGTRNALYSLYETLYLILKEKATMNSNQIKKLVINGDNSDLTPMTLLEYEQFLRTCSQIDFDTHLAIDIDMNQAQLHELRSSLGLRVEAKLKLV